MYIQDPAARRPGSSETEATAPLTYERPRHPSNQSTTLHLHFNISNYFNTHITGHPQQPAELAAIFKQEGQKTMLSAAIRRAKWHQAGTRAALTSARTGPPPVNQAGATPTATTARPRQACDVYRAIPRLCRPAETARNPSRLALGNPGGQRWRRDPRFLCTNASGVGAGTEGGGEDVSDSEGDTEVQRRRGNGGERGVTYDISM